MKPDIDLKPKLHPLLSSLSDYLKNPANYQDIQKKLLDTILSCNKGHADVLEFAKCPKCTENMLKRRKMLKELGFKNPAQYLMWKKTHEGILQRFPLVDWTKVNSERLIEGFK